MRQTTLLCILSLLLILPLACVDNGSIVEYLEITELRPVPNETNVDKATLVWVRLSREVDNQEAAKIRMRYIDDTCAVQHYPGYGLVPPRVQDLINGPFIWKPGRTVEVTIPKTISDPEGRTLQEDLVYRFSVAPDTAAFQLAGSAPQHGDTITLPSSSPFVHGILTFTDYTTIRDSVLSITPPATIRTNVFIIVDGRDTPQRIVSFAMRDLAPGSTYEIVIPGDITDYEGETLPHEYRIVFHTRP